MFSIYILRFLEKRARLSSQLGEGCMTLHLLLKLTLSDVYRMHPNKRDFYSDIQFFIDAGIRPAILVGFSGLVLSQRLNQSNTQHVREGHEVMSRSLLLP